MARIVRVAAAQYPLDEIASAAEFEAKLSRWVEQAAANGAQLLVFPEYAGMELARIAGRRIAADMQAPSKRCSPISAITRPPMRSFPGGMASSSLPGARQRG